MQEASVVILAAWAAQNPRLLLNSATDKHPNGLANASGLLGKYMMAHFAAGTWAMFDEDVQNHMGTIGAQFMSYDRYGKTSHKGAFGSTYITAGTAMKTSDLAGFRQCAARSVRPRSCRVHEARRARADPHQRVRRGDAEHREPHRTDRRQGRVRHAAGEDRPQLTTRMPSALWNANFEEGLKIAKATGAKEVWSGRGNMPTIHLFGGTIMGTGASNSVVNSYGQTHEIGNLYGSRAPASSRPRARRTRPTRSSRCRCAAPSISPPTGAASRGEGAHLAARRDRTAIVLAPSGAQETLGCDSFDRCRCCGLRIASLRSQ